MSIPTRLRRRATLVVASLALVAALPGVVYADTTAGPPSIGPASDNGITVSITGTPRLIGRVVVTFDVSFVCDPLTGYDWETGQEVTLTDLRIDGDATVLQAAGRSIAWGQGGVSGRATCDGTTVNTLPATVGSTSGLTFKPGSAVVGARLSAESDFGWESGSSGPVEVRLR